MAAKKKAKRTSKVAARARSAGAKAKRAVRNAAQSVGAPEEILAGLLGIFLAELLNKGPKKSSKAAQKDIAKAANALKNEVDKAASAAKKSLDKAAKTAPKVIANAAKQVSKKARKSNVPKGLKKTLRKVAAQLPTP